MTIEVPGPLFREMKSVAARRRTNLKAFVLGAIERETARLRASEKKRHSVRLPLVRSKHPGALKSMTNAEIEDLLG